MIELVFVVCMLSSPSDCRQEWPVYQEPYQNTLMCVREAQFVAAKWTSEHPAWNVRRWTCSPPRT
ncbi:hypothetical protein [Azospirillum sp. TSO22-1]|uniref:hypothetical protein n=1 Tax=Azospirillum sp. TSO22-1 TaxID=716789 RepID=UPI000D648F75|nr:hypothetical protein [Azospirillum sp. TSO22-1]